MNAQLLNLAKWGRDYLAMNMDINEMISQAADGDEIAKAALKILSSVGVGISGYYAASITRAIAAITDGIEPPYNIKSQRLDETGKFLITETIAIDKNFKKDVILLNKTQYQTVEEEFLF